MAIEFNKVTWYSKLGAVLLFLLAVPVLTFYIGMQYESLVSGYSAPIAVAPPNAAIPAKPLPIYSVPEFALFSLPVFTGKAFPFSFSYDGMISGDSEKSGAVGEVHAVQESLGIALAAPSKDGTDPHIDVSAWKAEGTDAQTASDYCDGQKNSEDAKLNGITYVSMTVNGYDACYSVQNPYLDPSTSTDHSFMISNDGYFVEFNFREQETGLTNAPGGDIYTQDVYTKFMPEYKAMVYSIKMPA